MPDIFQSTLPNGERRIRSNPPLSLLYFNPRSRTGSDIWLPKQGSFSTISIHAPERGATLSEVFSKARAEHFNPRSRTGSDMDDATYQALPWYFNPRSRTGSDFNLANNSCILVPFQSTLPNGERLTAEVSYDYDCVFQSTLPNGERPLSPASVRITRNFNPRSRTGSDKVLVEGKLKPDISIHAPERGATSSMRVVRLIQEHFNPRSRTGSDLKPLTSISSRLISIHAPERGATKQTIRQWELVIFQSTLPNGERLAPILCNSTIDVFQSTLPNGERPKKIGRDWLINRFQSTLPNGERLHHTGGFYLPPPYMGVNTS